MRLNTIQDLEKRIYHGMSFSIRILIEENLYGGITMVTKWLVDQLVSKIAGTKKFATFETSLPVRIKKTLDKGDIHYFNLFGNSKFINNHTKGYESATPFTDAVRKIYDNLFKDDRLNDNRLAIYSELKIFIERRIGKQLAGVVSLQKYTDWVNIDKILKTDYEIKGAWLESLKVAIVRSEKHRFASSKKKQPLNEIIYLHFSHRDQKKAAQLYTGNLRKFPKTPVFSFVEAAVRNSDQVRFIGEVSLQKRLSRKIGIPSFLSFIDQLKYPIAQDHAFFFIDELDDYVAVMREICSRVPRETPKNRLLLMALKNYFQFVTRSLSDLENLANSNSSGSGETDAEAKKEARYLYDDWMNNKLKLSIESILHVVFLKKPMSLSTYFLPFFEWLSSYRKLYLTHQVTSTKKSFIDLLHDCFLERIKNDSKGYNYLVDNILKDSVNHEALRILSSVLSSNSNDTTFRDKIYNHYLQLLSSEDFRWISTGDIDITEAINQSYSFALVLCNYPDAFKKWQMLFNKYRNFYEGWEHSPARSLVNYRESYILTTGIGIAYRKYECREAAEATQVIFDVIKLLLGQLRATADRLTIDYETPLWFAGATVAKFDGTMKDRFIQLIDGEVDSIKLYLRVIYDTLFNAAKMDLLPATCEVIKRRIMRDFFIIENNKTDVDLRKDFVYYKDLKEKILEMISG